MQEAVVEFGANNFDPLGQHEIALELARRNPAMQINPVGIVGLPATDEELVIFEFDRKIGFRESCDSERDTQAARTDLFDIIGWVALRGHLRDPVERLFEALESQQKGTIEYRHTWHGAVISSMT